ncbi:MAG: DHH family phosphoesterase [Oscillospiraceae bacterium]
MKKNKISRLLEPGLRLYFLCLVGFSIVSAFINPYLAAAEAVVVIVLYLYFRRSNQKRKKEILKYIDSFTGNMDVAAKDTMVNSPLPMVIFRPDNDEVIWSNERFLHITGEREHLFDTKLSAAVPDFSSKWLMEGKTQCPEEVTVENRKFLVFGHLVRTGDRGSAYLATTYWVDVTDLSMARDELENSKPIVSLLLLDNYEELMKNITDTARSGMLSEIDKRLADWTGGTGGLFCRIDRDRYLFLFEDAHLQDLIDEKFSILDSVREVVSPNGIPSTLSIGIGKDAPTFGELYQSASLSIEMALSRGGDQAVVKNRVTFEFYGGHSKELEKRTKVKSRVMANALGELIADASMVFVMGHKFSDLDTIGAAAGICSISRKKGTPAYILKESGQTPGSAMAARLAATEEYGERFLSAQDALVLANSSALLVVVDTNRPEQVQAEELLDCCTKVAVIDHHRRAATYIADAALNFHEPYASSASELVTELLQYIIDPADLTRCEAEALLAGIVLDTKNFTMRTGGRTFEAAAFLRRCGADTAEVKKLFQNDLAGTIARYDIIQNARMYKKDIALALVDHTIPRVTAAQAADELLNISGIDASFVLFPDGDRVIISARSMEDTNVQVILEALGGGGNAATAGAQVPGALDEVSKLLTTEIDKYFEDE